MKRRGEKLKQIRYPLASRYEETIHSRFYPEKHFSAENKIPPFVHLINV
jgi:hypothetical protein